MTVKFDKEIEGADEQIPGCYEHKIIVGACKMLDSKMEKSVNYDIVLTVSIGNLKMVETGQK